ncbi:aminoglycoside phosphotransferase family protein [Deinococcus taeanensis]|uniref:phosphotransferase family protein n=1 Tax=Deinococcus taeanensis TaxID=2737050 RepID=UPI001CDC2C1B|nr:aminoglycoside phosphotransferase family protein [Deinococcus taeanensis]UBV43910.1 aminoglycoside phosphotransferase family protein [Deinococcus taeanensis]
MPLGAWLRDVARAGTGEVAVDARVWPRRLRRAFPGSQLREAWVGEGAAFARYASRRGPLFLKYLPAGWRDARAAERLDREAAYLRTLAPLSPVPYAPLLHAAADPARPLAHLLTRDLTDETTGWGFFRSDEEREEGLRDVVRLLAQLHAFWAGPGQRHLGPEWEWRPDRATRRAAVLGADPALVRFPDQVQAAVQLAAEALPGLLRDAPVWTLVHGDIHAGQVLWRRDGNGAVLIDYGQVHASVPGEDLAHLLALRLGVEERRRLGGDLRATYHAALRDAGLCFSPGELAAQERAGLALNVLSTARQALRRGTPGVLGALDAAAQVWLEADAAQAHCT